ncbi:MAG: hypothetical protein HBSAPP04_20400 [Ignavibacteriaceae bacterium]|nr:MAG: hypothetical protein EDM75_10440 [Chlorobiota bacterium]GJQ33201.1 MAG: hypothetical protein HBSAPP04_20400 [Ignavibacteriaceae bacterium]
MIWFTLALTSAVLSSIAAITQKKALVKMNALEFSFHLSWVNLIICLIFLFDFNPSNLTLQQTWVMFVKTLLQALAFWCVMLSLKNLEISSALPLLALTPGSVAIFAFIFIGETLSLNETLGLILLLSGSYFIEMKTLGDPPRRMIEPFKVFFRTKKYIHVAAALAFFTISTILDKYLLKDQKMDTSSFMLLQHVFFLFDFAILLLITRTRITNPFNPPQQTQPQNPKPKHLIPNTLYLTLITAVLTIGYRYTQIIAFTLAPVALVIAIKRLSVFFASVVGGKIFDEGGLLKKGIAALIIVAGTLLMLFKNW